MKIEDNFYFAFWNFDRTTRLDLDYTVNANSDANFMCNIHESAVELVPIRE